MAKAATRKKTARSHKFEFNRLIKTKGKFSKGKLAIVAISLIAIGALLVNVTFAGFDTGAIRADNPYVHLAAGTITYPGGVYDGFIPYTTGIIWWGPYLGYTVNASGQNVQECAAVRLLPDVFAQSAIIRLDMTDNNGQLVTPYATHDFYIQGVTVSNQVVCFSFRIPNNSLGPLFLNRVEFRVWLIKGFKIGSGNGSGYNVIINTVSAHTY